MAIRQVYPEQRQPELSQGLALVRFAIEELQHHCSVSEMERLFKLELRRFSAARNQ